MKDHSDQSTRAAPQRGAGDAHPRVEEVVSAAHLMRLGYAWQAVLGPLFGTLTDIGPQWTESDLVVDDQRAVTVLSPIDFGSGEPFSPNLRGVAGEILTLCHPSFQEIAWEYREPGARRSRRKSRQYVHVSTDPGMDAVCEMRKDLRRLLGERCDERSRPGFVGLSLATVSQHHVGIVSRDADCRSRVGKTPGAQSALFDAIRGLGQKQSPSRKLDYSIVPDVEWPWTDLPPLLG